MNKAEMADRLAARTGLSKVAAREREGSLAMAVKSGSAADRAWKWSRGCDSVVGTTGKKRMVPSRSTGRREHGTIEECVRRWGV